MVLKLYVGGGGGSGAAEARSGKYSPEDYRKTADRLREYDELEDLAAWFDSVAEKVAEGGDDG